MIKDQIKKLLCELIYEEAENDGVCYDKMDEIRLKLSNIAINNINETIAFIKNEVSFREFSFFTEIIDDVVKKTQSEEFVNALYYACNKYKSESDKYNMWENVNDARLYLDKYYNELLIVKVHNCKGRYELNNKPGDKFYKEWLDCLKNDKKSLIKGFCKDMSITIDYFQNHCGKEEFVFLSRCFSKIARKTKSKEFVNCICEMYDKFNVNNELAELKNKIKYLKTIIKED